MSENAENSANTSEAVDLRQAIAAIKGLREENNFLANEERRAEKCMSRQMAAVEREIEAMGKVKTLQAEIKRMRKDIKALLGMLTDEYVQNHHFSVRETGVPDWITMAHNLAETRQSHDVKRRRDE